eukprot:GHVL01044526.1.p2 GENE.GHVL01044526.1~~GHVL01044526.1.p2  ORF type:complete len:183 (+),score=22.26 GHVL01044526.1:385-933(+)
MKFCENLGIDPCDPVILVFCYYCKCKSQGIFTKEEILTGCNALGINNLESLKKKIPEFRNILLDKNRLKNVYVFAFSYSLDVGHKNLPVDMCVAMWQCLLNGHLHVLQEWLDFIQSKVKNPMSRDTWMMVWELATKVKADLSNYDEDGAWPVIIDEFVEHFRKSKNEKLDLVLMDTTNKKNY